MTKNASTSSLIPTMMALNRELSRMPQISTTVMAVTMPTASRLMTMGTPNRCGASRNTVCTPCPSTMWAAVR